LLASVATALTTTTTTDAFAQQQSITGAGATFPAPLYQLWAQSSRSHTGIQVNYQSIGSGGGQNQIIARTVDFGASDAPLSPERLDSTDLIQVPAVMGAVVIIINIPGVETNKLKLSGDLLARIFMGQINFWNHPDIVAENPGLTLPRIAIAPTYRGDGSGTTFVFTSYLSSKNREFADKVGAGTSVRWPAGTGARGNDGVSGSVRQLRGSIGYVESAFAKINNIPTALLKNKAGRYIAPSMEGYISASQNASFSPESRFIVDLLDKDGDNTWPIVSATYLLIPRTGERRAAVVQWLRWAFDNGNDQAVRLDYVPLPRDVQDTVIRYLNSRLGL